MSDSRQGGQNGEPPAQSTSVWEWIAGLFGLILVAGSVGFLLYRASGDDTPPDITVRAGSVRASGSGYLVPFSLVNRGGSTAEGVLVEGQLTRGEAEIETSEATVTFVPSRSERKGGLFFTRNPRDYQLSLRAHGYQEP